jgi:hypothetical protein
VAVISSLFRARKPGRLAARNRLVPPGLSDRVRRAAGSENGRRFGTEKNGEVNYTRDREESLLTASGFDDVIFGCFRGLNDLAEIGELRLQCLDRLGDFDGSPARLSFDVLARFQLDCALCSTHANLLVRIPLT